MSQGEVTRFPQTNASLKVPSLGTVESILSETDESIFAKPRTRSQFEKIFEAIETTLQAQENHIVSQDTEMAGLHAKITDLNKRITDLNEHIVKISMASSGHSASNRARKSVIADPDIFKGDKLDNKKNQELFQTFSAEVELKMIGDDKCFETNREKILYVASRVSAPAYKNIKPWVAPVIESRVDLVIGRNSLTSCDESTTSRTNAQLLRERWQLSSKKTSHLSNSWRSSICSLAT